MANNFRRKKTTEQKLWEKRKLKMAGIDTEDIIISNDEDDIDLEIITKYKQRTVNNVLDNIFNFNNPLYLIGNKQSVFYEKYRNFEIKEEVYHNKSTSHIVKHEPVYYKDLPVYNFKESFLDVFDKNNIILVTGETGCGKSTLVPKFIFDKYKCRICVTQPRRISVKSLYFRMKNLYKSEVGFAHKFEQDVTPDTKIKYVTEGILLRELSSDPLLTKYDVIICDEVHERSVNIDIILGFLKLIRLKRKDLKIILMSATLQVSDYKNCFDICTFSFGGKQYPVEVNYLKINVDDYIEWTAKKILHIHYKEDKGDILVFLSGKEDIHQVYKILKIETRYTEDLDIIPLYSEIMNEVYDRIFNSNGKYRKCILSTNVAEASITIKNIKYVIDSGFHKISYYDYNSGERLIKYPISKENAIQRTGRAGRTMPGICYRMYTEESYRKDLQNQNIPDILRSNISNTILLLLSTNYKKIEEFPFISRPSESLINSGINTLLALKCIDSSLNMTKDGKEIFSFGVDVILGKLILEGINTSCSYDATLLASILSLDTHNIFDFFKKEKETMEYLQCVIDNNEFLTLINLFKFGFNNNRFAPYVVSKVKHIHDNLLKRITFMNYKITDSPNIQIAIIKTFFYNLCKRKENVYLKISTKEKYKIYNSDVEGTYILFFKSFRSKKDDNFMQVACSVDPKDILKYLKDFYKDINEEQTEDSKWFVFDNLYDRFEIDSDNEIK